MRRFLVTLGAALLWASAASAQAIPAGPITIFNPAGLTGTKSGNTSVFGTTNGTLTNGDCVEFDASGNLVDAGGACSVGGGGGTVSAGTAGQLTWYSASGTTVVGNANATMSTGTLTLGQATSVLGSLKLSGSTSGTTTISPNVTASGTLTLPAATDTLIGKATTDVLTNKTYDTAGTGNVFKINGTGISAISGSGAVVLVTGATMITPTLGAASATTINKVTITTPASSATLTIADGKSLTVSNILTFTGTDSSSVAFGTGGTVIYNGGAAGTPSSINLTNATACAISSCVSGLGTGVATFLGTPSSANLAAALTDETGSGAAVFGTSPTIASPTLTGTVAGTAAIPLSVLATQATNTVVGNATSGSASPTALSVGSCSTAGSALIWTTNTGFGCNTSITAAAVPASGLTGATLASGVTASSLTSVGTLTSLAVTAAAVNPAVFTNTGGNVGASFNGTNANGGYIITQSSGTANGFMGAGAAIGAGTSTDFAAFANISKSFYLGSNNAVTIKLDASNQVSIPNLTTGTNADVVCIDSSFILRIQAATSCTISSLRFKEDVRDYGASVLSTIASLRVITFRFKDWKKNPDPNSANHQLGLVAEDIAKKFPLCAMYERDMKTPKSFREDCLIAMLAKGIGELKVANDNISARLAKLEGHH